MSKTKFKLHRNLAYSIEHFCAHKSSYIWFYFKLIVISLLVFVLFNLAFGYLAYYLFPEVTNMIQNIDFSTPSSFKKDINSLSFNFQATTSHFIFIASYFLFAGLLLIPTWVVGAKFVLNKLEDNNEKTSILGYILTYSYFKRIFILLLLFVLAALLPLFNYSFSSATYGDLLSNEQLQIVSVIGNIILFGVIVFSTLLFFFNLADERKSVAASFFASLGTSLNNLIKLTGMYLIFFGYALMATYLFILVIGLIFLLPMEFINTYLTGLNLVNLNSFKPIITGITVGLSILFELYVIAMMYIYFAKFYILRRDSNID